MEPARAVPSRLASVSRQPKLVPEPVPVLVVQSLAFQHCLEQPFGRSSLRATFAEASNDLLLTRDVLQTKFSESIPHDPEPIPSAAVTDPRRLPASPLPALNSGDRSRTITMSASTRMDRGACRDRIPSVLCPPNVGDGNG